MRRLVFALALFVALLGSFIGWTVQAAGEQQFYYMGRWEWYQEIGTKALATDFDYWRCPGGNCAGLIDLRSIPQMSRAGGTPEGYGFFVYEEPQLNPSLYYLGNSLNYPLIGSQKQWIEENLSLVQGITQSTILDVLYTDLLILNGDPTGQDRWKPLRGSLKTGVKLYLANELVKREEFTQDHRAFQGTIDVFQADYSRLKSEGMAIEHLRKVTGAKMQALFGRMDDDLLEPLLGPNAADGWGRPSTTITESFPGTSDTFGGDLSWTEVLGDYDNVSDKGVDNTANDGWGSARADSDLSSDDHYTEVITTWTGDNSSAAGPCVRFAAGAETHYVFTLNASGDDAKIRKVVTGTVTDLDIKPFTLAAETKTVKLTVDTTTLTGLVGGVQTNTTTDVAISSNLRTGLRSYTGAPLFPIHQFTSFEAADLWGEAVVTNAYWYSMAPGRYMSP